MITVKFSVNAIYPPDLIVTNQEAGRMFTSVQEFSWAAGVRAARGPLVWVQFQADLEDYVRALRLPHRGAAPLLEVLRHADFCCARAHLVPSKPGYHSGEAMMFSGRACCVLSAFHSEADCLPPTTTTDADLLSAVHCQWHTTSC